MNQSLHIYILKKITWYNCKHYNSIPTMQYHNLLTFLKNKSNNRQTKMSKKLLHLTMNPLLVIKSHQISLKNQPIRKKVPIQTWFFYWSRFYNNSDVGVFPPKTEEDINELHSKIFARMLNISALYELRIILKKNFTGITGHYNKHVNNPFIYTSVNHNPFNHLLELLREQNSCSFINRKICLDASKDPITETENQVSLNIFQTFVTLHT